MNAFKRSRPGIPAAGSEDPGTRPDGGVYASWRRGGAAARSLVLAMLLAVGAAPGCGFLSTATAPPPFQVELPRSISLTEKDSVLANVVEAYRVGSVSAYMRGISQVAGDEFMATFSATEQQELGSGFQPTDPNLALLKGGWHASQEQNAVTSVMNSFSSSDSGRFVFYKIDRSAGDRYTLNYRVRGVPLRGTSVCYGSANITFVQDNAGKWAIKTWDDFPLDSTGVPATSYYGALRFQNRSQ
jgi:hypothetical protein